MSLKFCATVDYAKIQWKSLIIYNDIYNVTLLKYNQYKLYNTIESDYWNIVQYKLHINIVSHYWNIIW